MKTGVYQHFKGGFYIVSCVAKHTETKEEMVIYYNDSGEVFARPITMFLEEMNEERHVGPRFTLIKPMEFYRISTSELLK